MLEALTQGLFGDLLGSMFNGIILTTNTITGPISALIDYLFPNMSDYIFYFGQFISNYIGRILTWFSMLLPPITRNVIGMWLTFLIAYYTITWTYIGIMKVINIIQKLKIW